MPCITSPAPGGKLWKSVRVGRDFVDAAAGTRVACSGKFKTSRSDWITFESSLPISDTEHTIRAAAKRDGTRIAGIQSQASD